MQETQTNELSVVSNWVILITFFEAIIFLLESSNGKDTFTKEPVIIVQLLKPIL